MNNSLATMALPSFLLLLRQKHRSRLEAGAVWPHLCRCICFPNVWLPLPNLLCASARPMMTHLQRAMFALSCVKHKLRLPPHLLGLSREEAVKQELGRLFLDKVIPDLGLCISIYDIQNISGGLVVPGEGAPTYEATFRLVMFRPFEGEVLVGKIEKSDANGLHVSLGFFSDIQIPVHRLRAPYRMEESGIWVWEFDGSELFLDLEEEIRFRVESVKYPPIPVEPTKDGQAFAPMQITGSIVDDGLGLLSWWGE